MAVNVAGDFIKRTGNPNPIIICSTAHWSKFPEAVAKSLGLKNKTKDEFEMLKRISELKGVSPVPISINIIEGAEVRFKRKIKPDQKNVKRVIYNFLLNV